MNETAVLLYAIDRAKNLLGEKKVLRPWMLAGQGGFTPDWTHGRVFARGNRLSKEDIVTPGVPSLLANRASKEQMTRLDMARWIASPETCQ